MRILIVDDNAQVRRVIRATVEDLADDIDECPNGDDAVSTFGSRRPDWVLMDIEMPGRDGISATRSITLMFPDARVIIVSSHDSPKLRAAASTAGASGYVVKGNLVELRSILAA